jgi:hypothetical protein
MRNPLLATVLTVIGSLAFSFGLLMFMAQS